MAHGASAAVAEHHEHAHGHPTDAQYVRIAIFLTVVTIIEVAIWYIEWMHENNVLVPALFILSTAKFVTVVGYYMHLKFDDPRYRYIFTAGLVISIAIIAALFVLMITHRIGYAFGLLN